MTEDDKPTTPPPAGVVAAGLAGVRARLAGQFDRIDVTCALGLLMVIAGLWMWFSAGVALTAGGALVLMFGALGAVAQTPPTPAGPTHVARGG